MNVFVVSIVVLLIVLGVINLIVGVSNDAVNFLNSAIGSRIAPYWVIMAVASIGVVIGATLSNGMMSVGDKGILLPQYFSFYTLLLLFLGSLATNILVLDGYNTYGLPTSTSVTFIFSLLGGTLATALLVKNQDGSVALQVLRYFSSARSHTCITGLFWSVPFAFFGSVLLQYVLRILFSFDYQKNFKYLGPLWCSISLSFIVYYLVFQGFGSSSFATESSILWADKHAYSILSVLMIGLFFTFYYLYNNLNFNILKFQILSGTFALAVAFAGNDLVNFIGVSLTSLRGYNFFANIPLHDPTTSQASLLPLSAKTPMVYLLTAGLFIVLTIWLSKKAKTVIQTELQLSRQSIGYEMFKTSTFSNFIVNTFEKLGCKMWNLLPQSVGRQIDSRYQVQNSELYKIPRSTFDPIRASVNLTVSIMLISLATAHSLAISTTYITFMAAMGSSLADGAWGKENAQFRVGGVIFIFVGWVLTAIVAFSLSFIFTLLLQQNIWAGGVVLLLVGGASLIFFQRKHIELKNKREKDELNQKIGNMLSQKKLTEQAIAILDVTVSQAKMIFQGMITGLAFGDRSQLKSINRESNQLHIGYEALKDNIENIVRNAPQDLNGAGNIYVQTILGIGELSNIIRNITHPSIEYNESTAPKLTATQLSELQTVFANVSAYINSLIAVHDLQKMATLSEKIEKEINYNKQIQLNLIKTEGHNVKSGILYLKLLSMFQNFTQKTYEIAAMQNGVTIR